MEEGKSKKILRKNVSQPSQPKKRGRPRKEDSPEGKNRGRNSKRSKSKQKKLKKTIGKK